LNGWFEEEESEDEDKGCHKEKEGQVCSRESATPVAGGRGLLEETWQKVSRLGLLKFPYHSRPCMQSALTARAPLACLAGLTGTPERHSSKTTRKSASSVIQTLGLGEMHTRTMYCRCRSNHPDSTPVPLWLPLPPAYHRSLYLTKWLNEFGRQKRRSLRSWERNRKPMMVRSTVPTANVITVIRFPQAPLPPDLKVSCCTLTLATVQIPRLEAGVGAATKHGQGAPTTTDGTPAANSAATHRGAWR
jgi:hypothetical protein